MRISGDNSYYKNYLRLLIVLETNPDDMTHPALVPVLCSQFAGFFVM
jgi:hypothetical protein